jgi:hypothetical protein
VVGFAAHLRVYEPLGALPEDERKRWATYVESGHAPSRPLLMAREHEAALAAALAVPPKVDFGRGEQAFVRHLDGLTYVCPTRLQLRVWEALEDFCSRLPDEILEAFLPAPLCASAELAHDTWVSTNPDVRPGILSSTWSVPAPWFALFEAEERRLVLGERRSASAPTPGALAQTGLDRALVYLTAMSRARRRAARALHVAQRSLGDGPAVDALDEIGRWLEEFHPHSLVELDYGGLVHLLDDEALSADTSVAEIGEALEQLAKGEVVAAGELYEGVVARWRAVAALEHAN